MEIIKQYELGKITLSQLELERDSLEIQAMNYSTKIYTSKTVEEEKYYRKKYEDEARKYFTLVRYIEALATPELSTVPH